MTMQTAQRARIYLASGALLLLGCAFAAGLAWPGPRAVVVCALVALLPLGLFIHGLLLAGQRSAALPLLQAEPLPQQDLEQAVLKLESRFEHAPIALFLVETKDGREQVSPLNTNARRVVAPGRASDPASLYEQLVAQPAGRRSVIQFDSEQGIERALAAAASLSLQGQAERLVALMPVESELEAAALTAWRELVHVLTHEIMNSLTPVASLSLTAHDLLDDLKPNLPPDAAQDLGTALDAISRRAHSLANFVASYRSLSGIPPAKPERVELAALFARIEALVAADWIARGGRALFTVDPPTLEAVLDGGQLEQALINLVKNAAEATAGIAAPMVSVTARLSRGGRLAIDVCDNGPGVAEDLAVQIFTPFFTTKEKGTGIGLAVVRQLVHGNGGTVRYAKPLRGGARFIVTF